ncbi:MAG: SLC13 family permease [Planctomycetota bacterium]
MTLEIGYVLALLAVGLVLFWRDTLRIDVVALILLLGLAIPRVLTPAEALAGFGSETIIVLIALFVLTEGLVRTGVVERLGLRLAAVGGAHPLLMIPFLLVAAAAISAFVANTVTAAVFLPIVIGTARRAKVSPSRLLMPMAFATILSSSVTLISTSTNLVVSGQMEQLGLAPIGFFETTQVGLVISGVGLLYLLFVAPYLLPRTDAPSEGADAGRSYVSEIVVTSRSPLAGKTLGQVKLADVLNLFVIGVRRGAGWLLHPSDVSALREGDEIVVRGSAADILTVKDVRGIEIQPDAKHSVAPPEAARVVEAMVVPRSPWVGKTIGDTRFVEVTGLAVLAIHTAGHRREVRNLSRWRLKAGDALLVQGAPDDLARAGTEGLVILEDVSAHHSRSPRATWAIVIFLTTVVLASTGWMALSVAFLLGVLAMIGARCLTADEAYGSVDWRLLVLIASMMAFGVALQKTGASSWLASIAVEHVRPLGPVAVMGVFFLLTLLLSQPMSNQAAALVLLPIAVQSAREMNMEPRALAITVTVAASCSFLTPLEPACVLVYGPGRYRFIDFLRVGALLSVLIFVICMIMIPRIWPLTAAG